MHLASCITGEFPKHCFNIEEYKLTMSLATESGVVYTDFLSRLWREGNSRERGKPREKINTLLDDV